MALTTGGPSSQGSSLSTGRASTAAEQSERLEPSPIPAGRPGAGPPSPLRSSPVCGGRGRAHALGFLRVPGAKCPGVGGGVLPVNPGATSILRDGQLIPSTPCPRSLASDTSFKRTILKGPAANTTGNEGHLGPGHWLSLFPGDCVTLPPQMMGRNPRAFQSGVVFMRFSPRQGTPTSGETALPGERSRRCGRAGVSSPGQDPAFSLSFTAETRPGRIQPHVALRAGDPVRAPPHCPDAAAHLGMRRWLGGSMGLYGQPQDVLVLRDRTVAPRAGTGSWAGGSSPRAGVPVAGTGPRGSRA